MGNEHKARNQTRYVAKPPQQERQMCLNVSPEAYMNSIIRERLRFYVDTELIQHSQQNKYFQAAILYWAAQ